MNIEILVKSGTGGYYDYDNCDKLIKEIDYENFPIPRIGEYLDIWEENDKKSKNGNGEIIKEYHEYLVTNIRYWLNDTKMGVFIYVIPIGRSVE